MSKTSRSIPRSRAKTVRHYDPRMVQIWQEASGRIIEIPLPTRRAATTLRHQFYRLRQALEQEEHEVYYLATRVQIRITPVDSFSSEQDDPHILIFEPTLAQFSEALDAANITIPAAPDFQATTTATTTATADSRSNPYYQARGLDMNLLLAEIEQELEP